MAQNTKKTPKIDKAKLAFYKKRLMEEREALLDELAEISKGSLKVLQSEASGEVSYDEHLADSGTSTFERERDLSLENNIKDILSKIDTALDKMKRGTYGVCDHCGQPIDPARLKALPYANLCLRDKQAEEKAS